MKSRDQILAAVKANQPPLSPLPALDSFSRAQENHLIEEFITVLTSIGGEASLATDFEAICTTIERNYQLTDKRVVSTLPEMQQIASILKAEDDPHQLANVELAILPAHFAVAENGACWLSEALLPNRVLPFITQHLVLIVNRETVLPTMHEAYEKIGLLSYNYGVFIAGPSKTADIEQSLVIGAHGARSLRIFLI
ncbi:MAG: LUD domain-containing protein [Bacteroidota bacterium]